MLPQTVAGAENSVTTLYHGWFADGTEWDSPVRHRSTGYLVGGPNHGSQSNLESSANQPPAKSYLDFNDDWPNNSWEVLSLRSTTKRCTCAC